MALAVLGVLLGCADHPEDTPSASGGPGAGAHSPNILLVVVDTLRADRVGPRPQGEPTLTPFLDGLAARGTTFQRAYTPTPWTSPSVASLFTSRYPLQHRVSRYDSQLSPHEVTLAEKLAAAGYASAGFSANLYIQKRLGYGQGFGEWQTWLEDPGGGTKPRAAVVIDAAVAWAEARAGGEGRPGFLFLQLMEPHSPYEPPEPHRTRFGLPASAGEVREANEALSAFAFRRVDERSLRLLRSLYDGEVAFFDAALRELFERLEPTGFLEHAIVVVTADHGEEFREHGALLHGLTLFEPAVRVPLVVVAPGGAAGRVVPQNVSTLDVAATLLDLAGLPPEPQFEGRSLAPLLAGGGSRLPDRDVLFELAPRGGPNEVRQHALGILRGSQKLLVGPSGAAFLYDVAADPDERAPRGSDRSAAGARLKAELAARREVLARRAGQGAAPADLDAETRARLRALGYGVEAAPRPD